MEAFRLQLMAMARPTLYRSIAYNVASPNYDSQMTGRNVNMLLEVVDKNSKFGTFINSGISLNEQIDSNRSVFLKEGDRIRFGVMNSIWT